VARPFADLARFGFESAMEVEGKGLGVTPGFPTQDAICSTKGCDHPAQPEDQSNPERQARALCGCCRRRVLQQRLSALQVEISLLPGEIASLPRSCLHETRPEYENVST